MPIDLFVGKSSVQTSVYVFRVGEPHQKDDIVKFIDFSNDGYTRTNRKKSNNNLRDIDRAKERYQEIVDLVRFGKNKLNIFTEKEYYEGYIDPQNGSDWNQSAPIDTRPTLDDFKKTVSEYLAWEVSSLLKKTDEENEDFKKIDLLLEKKFNDIEWGEYRIGDLFECQNGDFDIQKSHINDIGEYVITAGTTNNGILGKSDVKAKIINENTITVDMFGNSFYRQFKYKMVTHARVFALLPKFVMSKKQGLYIVNSLKFLVFKFGYENMCSWSKIKNYKIKLPTKEGEIDFNSMKSLISELEEERISELSAYLKVIRQDSNDLSVDK